MDFSREINKPLFVVRENGQTSFVTPAELGSADLKKRMASLYAYLAAKLQLKETPKVTFTKDKKNANNPFGLTGYYDPTNKSIRLYITDRHDTDILRSFAHEVIHHWQNEHGTLQNSDAQAHYAQNDENLRKREMEAYLFGNILFRDWQDENRYGPPATPPMMPQPINENNLAISNSDKVKKGFVALLNQFIQDGTIGTFDRKLTSGTMEPGDFVNDFANKLVGALNGVVQTVNDRGNWESQSDMIQEGKVVSCQGCKAAFNYGEEPEVAMGAIACPFCKAVIDQEGTILQPHGRRI